MKLHLLLLILFFLMIKPASSADVTLKTEDYNNWGWECLVVENGYIEVVIIPELGGRILRYALPGDQHFAVNSRNIGQTYNADSETYGPWGKGYGYGGYKNWPAPQSYWNWPPPPHLGWGDYTYTVEHESADSVVIFMESPVETNNLGKGLQQSRRITVYKNSTLLKLEQFLTNVSAPVKDYAIWDITQVMVQHNTDKDYQNFSVYFPSPNVLRNNDNLNITDIDDAIGLYKDSKGSGKAFMNGPAWCANVDELEEQAYFKMFQYDEEATYSDQNANFQIYSAGDRSYIEIEVLSPLKNMAKGETIQYDEWWSAAKVKGVQYTSSKAGSILKSNLDGTAFSGEYGIFSSGSVELHYFDQSGSELGNSDKTSVEAGQKLALSETVPDGTTDVSLYAYNSDNKFIASLSATMTTTSSGVLDYEQQTAFMVYPTLCNAGEAVTIIGRKAIPENCGINLISLAGKTYPISSRRSLSDRKVSFEIPAVPKGMYLLQINDHRNTDYQKIMIQ